MSGLADEPTNRRDAVLVRLHWVEEQLVRGRRYTDITRDAAARYGMRPRQARRYVQAVYRRWGREGSVQDREAARARLRQMGLSLYETALQRQRPVTVLVGDGTQEIRLVSDPDVVGANRALEVLAKLEGLVQGGATVHNNTLLIGSDAVAALATFYGTARPALPPESRTAAALPMLDTTAEPVPHG
jgi:hypothetical protein